MRLYERYYADIDALNDDVIAELRNYHEETKSLYKCYYMDIPLDICTGLIEFDNEYIDKLLGNDWHKFLFDSYDDFRNENEADKARICIMVFICPSMTGLRHTTY